MANERAERAANILIAAAAVGAAVVVLRVPKLRRMARGLAVAALTRGLPTWVSREVQHAWNETGQREL